MVKTDHLNISKLTQNTLYVTGVIRTNTKQNKQNINHIIKNVLSINVENSIIAPNMINATPALRLNFRKIINKNQRR